MKRSIPLGRALGEYDSSQPPAVMPPIEPVPTKPRRKTNRHGVPVYDRIQGRCAYPRCPLAVTTYQDMQLCDKHVHLIVDEVKRREPSKFVVVRTVREAIEKPKKQIPMDGTIYYLEDDGLIKIGWTSNLQRRMRQFLPNHKLLAVEPGTRSDERKIHRRFAVHLTHGNEWFAAVPSIRQHIAMVRAKHGDPPADITVGPNPAAIPMVRAKEYTSPRRRNTWGGTRSWGYQTSKG